MTKIFILDTNIILHDYKSVRQFQENDIVIPIAVIEELDKLYASALKHVNLEEDEEDL